MKKHFPKILAIILSLFVVVVANRIFFPNTFDFYNIQVIGLSGLVGMGIVFELVVDVVLLVILISFFTVSLEENFFKEQ